MALNLLYLTNFWIVFKISEDYIMNKPKWNFQHLILWNVASKFVFPRFVTNMDRVHQAKGNGIVSDSPSNCLHYNTVCPWETHQHLDSHACLPDIWNMRLYRQSYSRVDIGMPWYRECSSNHEVTLNADEGIIETPAPDVYGSNCGGPIHPGICCRWRINVTNSKMRVQISILDSTLPIKRSGRCYKDNVITIVDSDNQKVDNLCGPVGLAQTVIVPTAGASIGFTGLLKDRAMATLHYKSKLAWRYYQYFISFHTWRSLQILITQWIFCV